jgi:hypothetical protein
MDAGIDTIMEIIGKATTEIGRVERDPAIVAALGVEEDIKKPGGGYYALSSKTKVEGKTSSLEKGLSNLKI